jgi:hypothetical protein
MSVSSGLARHNEYQGVTRVQVFGHQIPIRIQEKLKQVRAASGSLSPTMTLEPSGRLSIQIDQHADGIRKLWVDTESSFVEDHLNDVVVSLVCVAVVLDQRDRAEAQHRAAVRSAEETAAARAEAARLEAARRAAIESQAGKWLLGNDILRFVGDSRKWIASADVSDEDSAGLSSWYDWAERYAKTLIHEAHLGGAPTKAEEPSGSSMLTPGTIPRSLEATRPSWHPNMRWYHKR